MSNALQYIKRGVGNSTLRESGNSGKGKWKKESMSNSILSRENLFIFKI